MNRLFNESIAALTLETPPGCLGECRCFRMEVKETGELTYCGMLNVELVGRHLGCVNFVSFDYIASVVETSGLLDLQETVDRDWMSTVGNTSVGVVFKNGRTRNFVRDATDQPPILWAIAQLLEGMLADVEWGEDAFSAAEAQFDCYKKSLAERDEFLFGDERGG